MLHNCVHNMYITSGVAERVLKCVCGEDAKKEPAHFAPKARKNLKGAGGMLPQKIFEFLKL